MRKPALSLSVESLLLVPALLAAVGVSAFAVRAAGQDETSQPVVREAAKPVIGKYAEGVPPVLLSAGHAAQCRVNVGEAFPAIELPQLKGGAVAALSSLAGRRATVVLFWTADRWMSETALSDLARLEAAEGVAIVGIATGIESAPAEALLAKTGATFPQLLDAQGSALAQVGDDLLPRMYVLDADGRIAWFDVEYSEASRRELIQTLAALTR